MRKVQMRWVTRKFTREPGCRPCTCLTCNGSGYIMRHIPNGKGAAPDEETEDEVEMVVCNRCGGSGSINSLNDKFHMVVQKCHQNGLFPV